MGNTPSIVMDTDRAILGALHLFSPSLPIGAFAFSQGLEAAIESGHVRERWHWKLGVITCSGIHFKL